ncbi:hypothetical protein B0H12DRAFT_1234636 [Mycena haematopus]|nr:hypothetical protein B0H12DRAFT_1234636 [Mycena haematopus]
MASQPPKQKRAATKTPKAKRALEIAASEAQAQAAEEPAKKPRGRPRKKEASVPPPCPPVDQDELNSEPEVTVLSAAGDDESDLVIDWTSELTWTLITAIEDDEDTHDGLFPGIGAIKRTGGKPKTHHYYELAKTCFAEHEKYKDAFTTKPNSTVAELAKHRKLWNQKIKNRISGQVFTAFPVVAKENIEMMGQTGAGIETEEEISPGTALTTKWDLIKDDSPWFFKMRALIASRPNLQPVGIGNNDTDYDVSLLVPSHDDADTTSSAPDDTQDLPSRLASLESDLDPDPESDSDDNGAQARKRKKKKSVPTNTRDKFSATLLAEEETAQAALRLKKDKNDARKDVMIAKIRMEGQVRADKEKSKREKDAGKRELVRLKMEQDHQLRMAQYQSSSAMGAVASGSRSSPFYYDPELSSTGPSSAFGDLGGF